VGALLISSHVHTMFIPELLLSVTHVPSPLSTQTHDHSSWTFLPNSVTSFPLSSTYWTGATLDTLHMLVSLSCSWKKGGNWGSGAKWVVTEIISGTAWIKTPAFFCGGEYLELNQCMLDKPSTIWAIPKPCFCFLRWGSSCCTDWSWTVGLKSYSCLSFLSS
jgi:hypothetical protein